VLDERQLLLPTRWIVMVLAVLALMVGPSVSVHAAPKWLEWKIPYQDRLIRVHLIAPNTPGPWPTAMVLHGASGVGRGHMLWPIASALANRGVAAAVVWYYDGLPKSTKRKQSARWFTQRERIFDHMVKALLTRNEVKGEKLGVIGYSLGGFHTIGLAAIDRRIAAAVSLAGGLSGHLHGVSLSNAAPLMLIHGTRDRTVPYRRSRIARSAWSQAGQPVSLITLKGVGHVPYGATRTRIFAQAADFISARLLRLVKPPIPRRKRVVPVPRSRPGTTNIAKSG
jgi:dienelactone hydrolase